MFWTTIVLAAFSCVFSIACLIYWCRRWRKFAADRPKPDDGGGGNDDDDPTGGWSIFQRLMFFTNREVLRQPT